MSTLNDALQEIHQDRMTENSGSDIHTFRKRVVRQLLTEEHGRQLAIALLKAIRAAGSQRCRCNSGVLRQTDDLVWAQLVLKERGTVQACIGFAGILTDALGARGYEPLPELYEQLEKRKEIPSYRLRRLRGLADRGVWFAAVGIQTERG